MSPAEKGICSSYNQDDDAGAGYDEDAGAGYDEDDSAAK